MNRIVQSAGLMHGCRGAVSAAALGAALFAAPAFAQPCKIESFRKYFPPESTQSQTFGSSLAIRGDVMLVGDALAPGATTSAGRAIALAIQPDGSLVRTQTFWASDDGTNRRFGASIAINAAGDVAVVGAPGNPTGETHSGAAYVFRLQDGAWTQEAKLTPSDGAAGDAFGTAVAISGGFIVVGAPMADLPAANAGAAYVYSYDGAAWTQSQKLVAASPVHGEHFGTSVSITPQGLAVGAPDRVVAGLPSRGSALLYKLQGGTWTFDTELLAPDGANGDQFGFSVSLDADRLAVSAPNDDDQVSNGGSAWVFKHDGVGWQPESKIVPADSFTDSGVSSIVVLDGDRLAIGRPRAKINSPYAGIVSIATFADGAWSESMRLVSTPIGGFQMWLGSSVAFAGSKTGPGASVYAGAPADMGSSASSGALHLFKPFQDCDADGVLDACEGGDCDFNRVPDSCEIDSGLQTDCDGDGTLDLCQAAEVYKWDDGIAESAWGITAQAGVDFLWMNQFNVLPGFNTIDAVGFAWSKFSPSGVPITVVVYSDPNGDGDPHDAVLLTAVPWVVEDAHQMDPPYPFNFVRLRIPPTYLGPDGASFFVGAMMSQPVNPSFDGYSAGTNDGSPPFIEKSWLINAPLGQMDVRQIAARTSFYSPPQSKFLIRAYVIDANADGLPDICAACPGDITDDGAADIDDLFAVINAWGSCPDPRDCPADIAPAGGDDVVDVDDLFAVINAWGACP